MRLSGAAAELIAPIKDFLVLPEEARSREIGPFCEALAERIGPVEAAMSTPGAQ